MPRWLVWGAVGIIVIFIVLKAKSVFASSANPYSGFYDWAANHPWTPAPQAPPVAAPTANSQSSKGIVGFIQKADTLGVAYYTASAKIAAKLA